MKNSQQGFTLIELVMVIVILGILAATAIPRFVDLSADAERAAADGVRSGLASASAINYATRAARGAGDASVVKTNAAPTNGCVTATATALLTEFDTTKYAIAYAAGAAAGDAAAYGDTWTCKLTDNAGNDLGPGGVELTWTLHWTN